jgi:ATP/maltotriose-dependent transcriptional regulator MalT
MILAWHSALGDAHAGIGSVCRALDDYNNVGSGRATAFAACLTADIAIQAGQPRRALDLLAPVHMRGRNNGEWIYVPEIMRLEAIALSRCGRQGDLEAALDLLARARAMAIQHGSMAFLPRIEAAAAIVQAESGHATNRQARSQRKAVAKRFTPAQ